MHAVVLRMKLRSAIKTAVGSNAQNPNTEANPGAIHSVFEQVSSINTDAVNDGGKHDQLVALNRAIFSSNTARRSSTR